MAKRDRFRAAVLTLAVGALTLFVLAASGCVRSGASSTSESTATPTAATAAPQVHRVDVKGLIVTVEATSVPPAGDSWLQGNTSVRVPPRASEGNRLMWMRLTATNSTDATIAARVGHNFPSLRDSAGHVAPVLFPRGSRGPPWDQSPHGTVVAVAPYDVPRASQSYTMTWSLSTDRVAVITFVWP